MTTKTEFRVFVEQTLEAVIKFAEQRSGTTLSRDISFRWFSENQPISEGIVETIVSRVFVDEDHIYPCVDIGVGDLSENGAPVIIGHVAGYGPGPFQKNWTATDGPFVFIVGQPFMDKVAGKTRP